MRKLTIAVLLTGILLVGCAATTEKAPEEPIVEDPIVEESQGSESRTIIIDASNWQFDPDTIVLKFDEDVYLQIMGVEGNHGLEIPGLGIKVTIAEGETKTIKIPTDEPGIYDFFCNVYCGQGHSDMVGVILIEG